MLSPSEFESKFESLINAAWTLQHRILELSEFERQWHAFFDLLKAKTGSDCRINIRNFEIYRGFRWDKYHVAVSDLLSALENEVQNEHSLVRQSIHHLRIHPVEGYINTDRAYVFVGDPDHNSPEHEATRKLEIAKFHAVVAREKSEEAMRNLFPNFVPSSVAPSKDDINDLKNRFLEMREIIYSQRQMFAHKHQELIVKKHAVGLDSEDIEELKGISDFFFGVLEDIAFILYRRSYAEFSSPECKKSVEDQIDLILFGSVKAMLARFEHVFPGELYWRARERYFSSDHLLSLIVKD